MPLELCLEQTLSLWYGQRKRVGGPIHTTGQDPERDGLGTALLNLSQRSLVSSITRSNLGR